MCECRRIRESHRQVGSAQTRRSSCTSVRPRERERIGRKEVGGVGFAATCDRSQKKGGVYVFPWPMPPLRTHRSSRQHRDGVCTHNVVACANERRGRRRSPLAARRRSGQCAGVQSGRDYPHDGVAGGRRRPPHRAAALVCGRGEGVGRKAAPLPQEAGDRGNLGQPSRTTQCSIHPCLHGLAQRRPSLSPTSPLPTPAGCLPPHHLLRAPSRSRHMGSSTPAHAAVAARRTPKNAGHPAALITSVSGHPANAAPV